MLDRIVKIMEKEGLTSSRFAETIGIQRSAMSHILNKRNNVSLDVVMKVLEKFTYINPDWLLLGKGEMMKGIDSIIPINYEKEPINVTNPTGVSEYRQDLAVETLSKPLQHPTDETVIRLGKASKNVNKIMIFYSDNTFETFISEKSKKE